MSGVLFPHDVLCCVFASSFCDLDMFGVCRVAMCSVLRVRCFVLCVWCVMCCVVEYDCVVFCSCRDCLLCFIIVVVLCQPDYE